MKNIKQIDIKNKRILIRVDFNVPIINKEIQSDFRIKAVKETIDYCIKNNTSIVFEEFKPELEISNAHYFVGYKK